MTDPCPRLKTAASGNPYPTSGAAVTSGQDEKNAIDSRILEPCAQQIRQSQPDHGDGLINPGLDHVRDIAAPSPQIGTSPVRQAAAINSSSTIAMPGIPALILREVVFKNLHNTCSVFLPSAPAVLLFIAFCAALPNLLTLQSLFVYCCRSFAIRWGDDPQCHSTAQ